MKRKPRRKPKPKTVAPTDRESAGLALSFLLEKSSDQQIKQLLKKTLQDWADWLWPGNKK